jgi:MFS family permease
LSVRCSASSASSLPAFEFIGSIGLSVWTTAGTIVVADVSGNLNRGRAVALRTSSQRLGNMIGPIIAGFLGRTFGLYIFMVNFAGKFCAFLIFLFMIRESRPEAATAAGARRQQSLFPSMTEIKQFVNVPVIAVLFATAAISLVSGAGAFESLFPIHASEQAGMDTAQIGWMVSLVAAATFVVGIPNGVFMDRFGRKASLLPGMAILGLASFMISGGRDFMSVLLAIIVLGVGEGMCQGTAQVLAMDLAPEDRRGAFLGVWQLLTSITGVGVPLALGTFGTSFGTTSAFVAAGVGILLVVPIVGLFGPETRKAEQAQTASAA